jgi:uncharacterized Zn-binding protein involved in type VI secretion
MLRKIILVGDPPSTGGAALPHDGAYITGVDGRPAALIGGKVSCNACQTTGVIFKAGGPYRKRNNGQEIALEGDRVRCKCEVNPTMVSAAGYDWLPQVDDQIEGRGEYVYHSRQFQLKDANGSPMPATYYTAKLPDNEPRHGITDDEGMTELYETDGPKRIEIHIGHLPAEQENA